MITVKFVVDVVAALEARTLAENLYLFDTNRRGGSRDQGTDRLATAVKEGDMICWTIAPLECEVFAEITSIQIPLDVCEPQRQLFPGTSVVYWTGVVKKVADEVPYSLTLGVGHLGYQMAWGNGPKLIKSAA